MQCHLTLLGGRPRGPRAAGTGDPEALTPEATVPFGLVRGGRLRCRSGPQAPRTPWGFPGKGTRLREGDASSTTVGRSQDRCRGPCSLVFRRLCE